MMRFAVLRICREPSNHLIDCYRRRKGKNVPTIDYPDIPSSVAPVLHNVTDLPVPQPPSGEEACPMDSEEAVSSDNAEEKQCTSSTTRRRHRMCRERYPYYPNQDDINDLVRDMTLTKSNAELLISRLSQWDLIDDSVRITSQRKRHRNFSLYFQLLDDMCFCHDIQGLFDAMGIPCNVCDWRLFIDSSRRSLKAVLLHNTNQWPSIPLAHSVHMKENYENVKVSN